jgi:hypothetical protein
VYVISTELYYITGGRARDKKVKPKTWRIFTPFPWQLVPFGHGNTTDQAHFFSQNVGKDDI